MAYNYPKVVRNVDGTFGPTIVHHYYKPVGYHNRGAAKRVDKSKWRLKLNVSILLPLHPESRKLKLVNGC